MPFSKTLRAARKASDSSHCQGITNVGKNIKAVREVKNISQRTLAHWVGMNGSQAGSYICGVEKGTRNPCMSMLGQIAEALEVGVDELFNAKEHKFVLTDGRTKTDVNLMTFQDAHRRNQKLKLKGGSFFWRIEK